MTMLLSPLLSLVQGSRIEVLENKYTVAQDMRPGREASTEVERPLPLLPEAARWTITSSASARGW